MAQSKPNLFRIAQTNAASLEEQLKEVQANMDPQAAQKLADFLSWFLAEARISINLPAAVLATFSRGGVYLNIHAWASEQETLSGRGAVECLRERLGTYFDRRLAFDTAFENGEKFVYAAVNAGGPGLSSRFDTFCVVLAPNGSCSPETAAYLPGDSLDCCFDESGAFSLELVSRMICPHPHCHCLAAVKLGQRATLTPRQSWPSVVLSDTDYIEVVLASAPGFNEVAEIRVHRRIYDDLWNLAFANFARKLSDAEKALVLDFTYLVAESREGKFRLEVVS